ncbi:MerR family transcriptional regulator [Thiomicrospira microaerophila]|uniref:MerR family transcriptional regulator n=1 Tax=Thiomicrospira microaerophila TaxID=406020 RepID=UPI0006968E4E|nr:MerR family transcriptional regulator [Thiomicrospira microaerophila]
MKQLDPNALFPIREVSRLTGIKPITLRAWERRYDLIEPVRTDSGHRLYTQDHIDYLNQALKLMDEGIPISRVKTVLSESPISNTQTQPEENQSDLTKATIRAVNDMDLFQLERCIDRLFADYSLAPLLPLLETIENALQKSEFLAINLWQTRITQRFQVRLHQFQQSARFLGRIIFIQATPSTPNWYSKYIGLFCFEQGYQPLVLDQSIPLENIKELHEKLALYGFILIDNQQSNHQEWAAYIKHFSSIKSWVFGDECIGEESPPSVNCELRARSQWLQPL